MDVSLLVTLALAACGILLLALLFKILKTPLKWAFKLLLNTLTGFVALLILNFFGSWVGISLGVNWINAIIVGVLGLPGVVLLLLLKYIF
jgi:inhibitor of the pro-sigma K processing machinery